jgi:saccharopine dehydrogenase-like NADP-dependent oxidoreductase
MAKETVEKVSVLADFGFDGREPVQVKEAQIAPRDFMIAMMGDFVPSSLEFLQAPPNQAPDWAKEIVTEVKGQKDGQVITYRLGTLTLKGALPTGVVPARGAVWQAEGCVPPGVHPPELAFDPGPFLKELEERDITTFVTTSSQLT